MPAQDLDRPFRLSSVWRSEGVLFALSALLLFVYCVLRGAIVPITFEEAERFHRFIQEAGLKPLGAPWGAADHPFTVVLADVLVRLLGDGRAVLRIPALLCFPVFAWYVWRCTSAIADVLIRRCTLAALVAMPLVLDFFSLFSGHGPATAFLLAGLWHASLFMASPSRGDLTRTLLALFAACLGTPALFPLFILLAAMFLWTWTMRAASGPERRKRLLVWLPITVLLALLINGASGVAAAVPGHNEGDDGVVGALLRHVFGDNLAILRWVTLAAFLLCTWIAVRAWLEKRDERSAWLLGLCVVTILVDLAVRMAQYYLGDASFPSPGSTIHLAVLFVLACALALERYARTVTYRKWAALVLLVFPIRTVLALNVSITALWPREAIPDTFYAAVAEQQQAQWRGSYLVGLERMVRCWSFGTREHPELGLPAMQVRDLGAGDYDALIVERHQSEGLMDRYRLVDEVPHHGPRLLMREPPLRTTTVRDTALNLPLRNDEYRILAEMSAVALRGRACLVELQGLFVCDTLPKESPILVVEVRDSSDQQLRYEGYKLLPPDPTLKRPVLLACGLDALPATAQRTSIYLWNPSKSGYALTRARLRIHQR